MILDPDRMKAIAINYTDGDLPGRIPDVILHEGVYYVPNDETVEDFFVFRRAMLFGL